MSSRAVDVDFSKLRAVPRTFYNRDARRVAREILGKVVVRRLTDELRGKRDSILAGRIVEVEAYLGEDDPAAHAAAGKTPRNEVLFGPPGHAYVYFIYGNHYCLNFSCEREGKAGCVLIRALGPLAGIEEMGRLRGMNLGTVPKASELRLLTSGPGRLCQAMAITRARDNGKDVCEDGDLIVVDDGFRPGRILTTARVGITKAADEKLRYLIVGNAFVSGPSSSTATRRR